jgi:hypothetical protein
MHRPNTPTASEAERSAMPAVSREELARLERQLDLYLAFWACARDGHCGRGSEMHTTSTRE